MITKLVPLVFGTGGLLIAGISLANGQETSTCTRVTFSRNAASTTVSGTAEWMPPFSCYKLVGHAGHTATLRFTKANTNTAFNVAGVVDNQDRYSFKIADREYIMNVYQTLRAAPAPFTLSVSIRK